MPTSAFFCCFEEIRKEGFSKRPTLLLSFLLLCLGSYRAEIFLGGKSRSKLLRACFFTQNCKKMQIGTSLRYC